MLASRFGTGITHSRYAPEAEHRARERHLTLCNLVVARSLFERATPLKPVQAIEEAQLTKQALRDSRAG